MEAITIVGAGGIGCAVGYALCAAGIRVTFVDADEQKVLWGRQHGVIVDGLPPRRADFQHFSDWQPSNDVVLLCTKCYDNAAVLCRLPREVTFVPIQNGFDAQLENRGHSLEGIASFVSECEPQTTRTRITRRGGLHLGHRGVLAQREPDHAVLHSLAAVLGRHAPFRVHVVSNILPYKYSKLMYNAAISPVAAAAGLDNGQLLSVPLARRLFFALLRENYAILSGAGIVLGKIGLFHPATVNRILQHRVVARSLAWAFYPSLRGSYCSMSGDLPKGRTEIDYYNGRLIELAKDRPCPNNRSVHALVKRMERERLQPEISRLNELDA